MNSSIIKIYDPIKAWKEILHTHSSNSPLFIETDLNLINEKNNLHIKMINEYLWHYNDTQRSLLKRITRPLTKFEFSYYDRIIDYFNVNQLDSIISNHNLVITTWDPKTDANNRIKPCLVTLKLIEDGEFLHLSVTFRSRDIIKRLYFNFIALSKFQNKCCQKLNKKMGLLFDYSNQASYNFNDYLKVTKWDEFNEN